MKEELDRLRAENEALKAKIQRLESECWFDTSDLMRIFKCSDTKIAKMRKQQQIPYEHFGGTFIYPKIHFTHALVLKSYKNFKASDLSQYPPSLLKDLGL